MRAGYVDLAVGVWVFMVHGAGLIGLGLGLGFRV